MKGIDLSKHFALTSSQFVQQICAPILANIGITYFNYLKIYHEDNSRELLTNNAQWIDHFYKNELYKSAGTVDIEHLLPKGYFLWNELDHSDPIYVQGREFFNIDNGISFVVKREDVTFLYIFASTRDNLLINNFYVRNTDLFKRFILFFNDKGASLLGECSKNRIYLPNANQTLPVNKSGGYMNERERKRFYESVNISRYYLPSISDELYLTRKQAECIAYLTEGATAKQCAKALNISYRTVEGYTNDIKDKIFQTTGKRFTKDKLIQLFKGTMIYDAVFPNKITID